MENEKKIKCQYCQQDKPLSDYGCPVGTAKKANKMICLKCADIRSFIIKETTRAATYGMTYDELCELKRKHNNQCAICGKEDRRLEIDHCHISGMVRGLLCHPCNTKIGYMEGLLDRGLLIKAVEYIDSSTRHIINNLKPENKYD